MIKLLHALDVVLLSNLLDRRQFVFFLNPAKFEAVDSLAMFAALSDQLGCPRYQWVVYKSPCLTIPSLVKRSTGLYRVNCHNVAPTGTLTATLP